MSDRERFYITTAIAYPNGAPHLGHAYEYISADTLARFQRLDGKDVLFLTGTDEHGQKVQRAAEAENITPHELARRNSDVFQALQDTLGSTYDRFIRTTDADHHELARALWERMAANGDIYLDAYAGWYSVRDESFYTEAETTETADGRIATETGTAVEWTEEQSYFFRLSAYQDKLLALYDEHPEYIGPDVRRNEIVSFVKGGLRDLSISRNTFDWGVEVPGDPGHVMYVWIDALANYLTGANGLGLQTDPEAATLTAFWPADLHIIGKDIVRFHCVYWPAFLMSAGIALPRRVFAHGFLFNRGEKMSKSTGNVVSAEDMFTAYGLDAVRYFLLREVPYGQDGSYSDESIVARKNADLANDFGNLAQRTASMIARYFDGVVPTPGAYTAADEALLAAADALLPTVREHFTFPAFHLGLEAIWSVLAEANRYVSAQEPWKLAKTDLDRTATVLFVCAEVVRIAALLTQPVMPESSAKLLDTFAVSPDSRTFAAIGERLSPGTALPTPTPVFPRHQVQ